MLEPTPIKRGFRFTMDATRVVLVKDYGSDERHIILSNEESQRFVEAWVKQHNEKAQELLEQAVKQSMPWDSAS